MYKSIIPALTCIAAFATGMSATAQHSNRSASQVKDTTAATDSIKTQHLQGVTVTGRRPLIQSRPGMLVYNAEDDLTNKGGSAADVLRKAPLLAVDADGNVSMRGNTNLKVLINGKATGQVARNSADVLNMMPASMIKSIEIISSPSVKYDAEGAAGVINIITKRGGQQIDGAIEIEAGNMEQVLNPRLNLNSNKWSIAGTAHVHRLRRKNGYSLNRTAYDNNGQAATTLHQERNKENVMPHGSAEVSIDYDASENSRWSFSVNSWFGNWPDNAGLYSQTFIPGNNTPQSAWNQDIHTSAPYLGGELNAGYYKRFAKPRRELTILTQYSKGKDVFDYHTSQTNAGKELLYSEQNNSRTDYQGITMQLDYVHPFTGSVLLETGVKGIFRKADNDYSVAASDAPNATALLPVPGRTNLFRYRQRVAAAYAMLKYEARHNWYFQAGARWEGTWLDGHFRQLSNDFNNYFGNFIPGVMLSKKAGRHTLKLSYTQRISRPYIWDLNPNTNQSDLLNNTVGNPSLRPEVMHQAELAYSVSAANSAFFTAALYWKQTDNAIEEVIHTDLAGIATTMKQNLAANKRYGVNLSAAMKPGANWSLSSNIDAFYIAYKSDALDIYNDGLAVKGNINITYKLPRNYSLQAFGEYGTRKLELQGTETSFYYYSFSAKKELPVQKMTLTLALVNPFSSYVAQTQEISTKSFIATYYRSYYNRSIKLTLNWNFGRSASKKATKKISNEDVKEMQKG